MKIFSFVVSACTLTSLVAAQATVITQNLQSCIGDGQFQLGIDYFPNKFTPRKYSPIFLPENQATLDMTTDLLEIEYFDYYKIVTNKYHNKTYLLYQCGATPPMEEVLSGRHQLVLPIPHKGGLAITETPQIPPLELLGLRQEIIAYIGDPQYVSSPCLNYAIDELGSVEVVFDPEDPWNSERTQELTDEFLSRHPEAIIFGGIFANASADRIMGVAETQERTNVATFDWISLYAALFNLEELSNEIAKETEERYQCSSANARSLSSDIEEDDRPVIFWADFFEGYNWSVAECPTWDHTYYCEYASHCGAHIISRPEDMGTQDEYGYWYLNDDEVLKLGKDADIFVFPSLFWDTVYEQKRDILDQFKAVQNKRVYDTQGGGPNAWYEQRLAEYDVVGNDFCAMVGLSNPNQDPPHTIKWLRNVFTGTVPEEGTCNVPENLDDQYVPVGAFCAPVEQLGGPDEGGDTEGSETSSSAPATHAGLALVSSILYVTLLW
ncbi:ABC transporter substrate-binding protein [Nitzschia inconspicua]|uniref:ABC transporter substrate-binding protein n=1 Tax=Nitzschia inconspicua TaxID=303405 RepID=A0A9K3L6S8_9STRA|nr:ABC transporter substrate-binding protein [Nitzschia inconspicua]